MWQSLRLLGIPIVSTWIDEAGASETADRGELAQRCISEAVSAKAVLLYCEPGETLKGALVEVGAALAHNVPVYCVGECEGTNSVFADHPLWNEAINVAHALGEIADLEPGLAVFLLWRHDDGRNRYRMAVERCVWEHSHGQAGHFPARAL